MESEKDDITGQDIVPAVLKKITKKPIVPTDTEIRTNPRSRSAKLRIAQKV
jgi:16S rRNA (cytosine1402-N4)-methyltransferase